MKNYQERKEMLFQFMGEEMYVPMKEKELVIVLQVTKQDREEFTQILKELILEGKICISKRGKYSKCEVPILVGTFISHPKGFGFVEIEGYEEDFYIAETEVNGAFHKDTVQVQPIAGQGGKRKEAKIVEILQRGMRQIVGTYQQSKSFGFVVPDNNKVPSDIFVSTERSKGAVEGHKVVVEITDYGKDKRNPEGKVIEILGHKNDPGVDILALIRAYELPLEFGEKVMNQAERIPDEISEADCEGRKDLRDLLMVTIDGEDAKDLDDAVSLERDGDKYRLGVHIADVANYVQENSALDREALERGTSVYLADRVIPMLPHRLSNGICSLNAGVDRLALSCIMTIDHKGEVVDYEIAETVICVSKRLSYTQVANILEDKEEECMRECEVFVPMLEEMEVLAGILRTKRKKRGSIDFDFPESKVILGEDGKIKEIKPYDRNTATKLIEDFMLIANETIAQNFFWLELPFLYRTHEKPDAEKLVKLAAFLRGFGYHLKFTNDEVYPKEIQKLLSKMEGTKEEALVSRLTLRSMKQAKYTVPCSGHFGLACTHYSHFTSPIRRYPDLQIHRIIKEYLRGKMQEDRIKHYKDKLEQIAKQSSERERRAEEVERETLKLKKVEYMQEHIGEVCEGVISGITNWGIYVELSNTIEGMIHVATLSGDYYYFKEQTYEMVGEKTGRIFQLGEAIHVLVKGTDKESRTIDFALVEE